jgi:hypothetical protein
MRSPYPLRGAGSTTNGGTSQPACTCDASGGYTGSVGSCARPTCAAADGLTFGTGDDAGTCVCDATADWTWSVDTGGCVYSPCGAVGAFCAEDRAICSGAGSVCSGAEAVCSGTGSLCRGERSSCTGEDSSCRGADATCSGDDSSCSGTGSLCTGEGSSCTGADAICSGEDSTCTGEGSSCTGDASACPPVMYVGCYEFRWLSFNRYNNRRTLEDCAKQAYWAGHRTTSSTHRYDVTGYFGMAFPNGQTDHYGNSISECFLGLQTTNLADPNPNIANSNQNCRATSSWYTPARYQKATPVTWGGIEYSYFGGDSRVALYRVNLNLHPNDGNGERWPVYPNR